ncbi:SDR family NAD(P)-dependent oxidoreductase [Dongia deserti]|uniref:SDR family NAD(P)-dependent oxidoreductase n=1 Tax=Dongia deserti TaxID=2268030 RepID=UPI000E65D5B1|nr:SDR family NAD(P)-dependent oxidoreductase [Dongia deserti]
MAETGRPITLITGASSGIGAALAKRLARHGDHVILVARRLRLLQDVADEITKAGGSSEISVCDVTIGEAARTCVTETLRKHGRIDRLILNAGGGGRALPENLTSEEIRAVLELNLFGVVNFIEAALPTLLQQSRGQIVAVGSIAGYRGLPRAASYGAAKAALMNYMESLRIDLAPKGISVTLAAPGFVVTKDTKKQRAKPMAMQLDRAADILTRSILKKKRYVAFPWPLVWLAHVMRLLPAGLYDRLIRRLDRNSPGS